MKIATITWIPSTTPAVTKHLVFRDDLPLGEVLIANPPEWIDENAVEGENYKYEIQASTPISDSEQEVETVNVQYVEISVDSFLTIHTTSTSSTWMPSVLVNTGNILGWQVTGGIDIPLEVTDTPVFDLSGNTGTAVIVAISTDAFVGLTELQLNNLEVTLLDVSELVELNILSCKGDYKLTTLNIDTLVKLTTLTIRTQLLTEIDITNNILLEKAWLYDNQIDSIDISQNPLINLLSLHTNLLPTLVLDDVVNELAGGVISNGDLFIDNNSGKLSSNAIAGYNELDSRFWTIDVGIPVIPEIPTGITLTSN